MKQFTAEDIQAKFETLPKEIQAAITSTEINEKIEAIGAKHNLHIDQIGELVDQIGLVMLGLESGSNFVKDISERLSVPKDDARAIADEINTEVFSAIKTSMRENSETPEHGMEASKPQTVSDLEQAGKFTIEKDFAKEAKDKANGGVKEEDKAKILDHIENPPWRSTPETTSADTKPMEHETFTEPIVDLLLANPSARPAETVVRKIEPVAPANLPIVEAAPSTPKPIEATKPVATPIPKRTGPDPYKEPIE